MTLQDFFPYAPVLREVLVILFYLVAILGYGISWWNLRSVWNRFVQQQVFTRLTTLHSLTNQLLREARKIQQRLAEGQEFERQPMIDARNVLAAWFQDHRFLLTSKADDRIGALIREVDQEAKEFARTGRMDKLQELRQELERRLLHHSF